MMTHPNASPAHLDACFVNTIIAATSETLASMTQTTVAFKEARAQRAFSTHGNVLATLGFTTGDGEGMAAISFPEPLGNSIVSRLLDLKLEQLNEDDQCDGIGELVSLVSGDAKSRLSALTGSKYNLGLPSILLGAYPEIPPQLRNVPVLLMVFEAEEQTFTVQIAYSGH